MRTNYWLRVALTFGLLPLFLLSPVLTVFAQTTPQIRITQVDTSAFPQVTVYVSVIDAAGEPVGVEPERIQLSENGQAIQPSQMSGFGEIGPLTSLLVVDVSGSMNNNAKLDAAKQAALAYVEQMRPGDQAGLMVYNTEVTLVQPVTPDREALTAAVNSLTADGNTAMFDAILQAEQTLTPVSGRKAILVLADGIDNVSQAAAEDVITAIGPSGVSISTIGLGDPEQLGTNSGLDEAVLRSLAEQAGGVYSYANDPDSLQELYERYARVLQSEYRITFTSTSTLRDGVTRSLTISLAGGAVSEEAQYNPGGVLPEVSAQSWPLFGAILAGLLVLLFAPMAIGRLAGAFQGAGSGKAKSSNKAKGRIKLK
jgi:VWFA-related protein